MPATKAATTLRSKKENYNQRIGERLLPTLGLNLPGEKCLIKAAFPQLPLRLTAISQVDHQGPKGFFLLSASKCAIPSHTLAWLILPTVDLGLRCYSPNFPEPHNRPPSQHKDPPQPQLWTHCHVSSGDLSEGWSWELCMAGSGRSCSLSLPHSLSSLLLPVYGTGPLHSKTQYIFNKWTKNE